MKEKSSLIERKVETKFMLMSAWIALMFLYLYCDFFTMYRPGAIGDMTSGRMGFMAVSQLTLVSASILMIIPSLMVFISAIANARMNRLVNLLASALYFLVNVGNLLGETWAYYYLFGLLELGLVAFIFIVALRWPRQDS